MQSNLNLLSLQLKITQKMSIQKASTKGKALRINLQEDIYGCFAEIGAGQEVAANFFKAGASSMTIAYTQSAYDMKVSDGMYGQSKRYVSEERLMMMLYTEYETLSFRLPDKKEDCRFFAFCNTVESLNYAKTNQGQGWIGIRFQLEKGGEPNDIILHVRMYDKTNIEQQKALGILGVNLIHAAYFTNDKLDDFLDDLVENLSRDRIEVDMLRVTGPSFKTFDNRMAALNLVKKGMTEATMFDEKGNTLQPSDELYKRNILLFRGRFRPLTKVHEDIIENAKRQFIQEKGIKEENLSVIIELTIKGLTYEHGISVEDFMDRASLLNSLGYTVMISNFYRHYRMVEYLSKVNRNQWIGLAINVFNLETIFKESQYTDLDGGAFQGLGTGFSRNVQMLVYPGLNEKEELITLDRVQVEPHLKNLLQFLKDNEKVSEIQNYDEEILHVYTADILQRIQNKDKSWENDVPAGVAKAIKSLKLFGYKD